jgi:DNA-binding NtrC family response regulator
VRELQNVMERLVQLIPNQVITPQDLEMCLDFTEEKLPVSATSGSAAVSTGRRTHMVTKEDILLALEENRYNRTLAAAALGISRKTFYRKLDEFQIVL